MEKDRKVYFLSDLHLGAPYFDNERKAELKVVRFLDSIKEEVSELYLLGDILDYWFEYRYVVPKGFVRFFGKLAELSDRGVKITWIIGNHDIWLFDYLPSELGIEVADGPILRSIEGKLFFLAHGDGLGKTKLTFRIIRTIFRNKLCQRLYAGIHPRWTVPFAKNWSRASRSGGMKSLSSRVPQMVSNLKDFTQEISRNNPLIDYFVYGHLHVVDDITLPNDKKMVILGDWISNYSYATYSEQTGLRLHKYTE
ncbi:MAG: UDP-2,3-diacylglucosamine diphosphatase [Muribaculum sp.]|nr:UDP-2,3-diacylglucosamine diphosphatase [Muribaculum sp.]